ncbi:MAG: RNA polymerase sigma-70 factor [Phaeodactylibacter sp.]|nr:RNA polymerase sigma-70 factor [Phaeodactylibacter sp.]
MQQEYTDQELQVLLAKDSDQAIILIFQRYYSYLCQAVYKIIPDENLVEDLVQEVFLELWRKREKLQINTSLKAYLRRAAVNRSLNYIRDRKIRFDVEESETPLASTNPTAGQQIETMELQGAIDQAIDRLPERCRAVFVLSRFEDMSYIEIARQLGISVKTVENQISKALKLLREALSSHWGET